jgi:hypothetical protein
MASPRKKPAAAVSTFADTSALESALATATAQGTSDKETLAAIVASPALNEDLALTFLKRRDLPQHALEALARNGRVMKSRKVKCAVVEHPQTPRHVSLPLMRHMYTFELMQVALLPGVAADVKLAVEDVLVSRLTTLSPGERLTLAKRSSGRVAAALLQDTDKRVIPAALNNPYLTETLVAKALVHPKPSPLLAGYISHHQKWTTRKDVQLAALRNEFTPLAAAIRYSEPLPLAVLRDLLKHSGLSDQIKRYLLGIAEKREARRAPKHPLSS